MELADDVSREERLSKLAAEHGVRTLHDLLPLLDLHQLLFAVSWLPRRRIVQLAADCAATACDLMPQGVLSALSRLAASDERNLNVSPVLQTLRAEADRLSPADGDQEDPAPFLLESAPSLASALGASTQDVADAIRAQREQHEQFPKATCLSIGRLHATLAVCEVAYAARILPPSKGWRAPRPMPVYHLKQAAQHAAIATLARSGQLIVSGRELPEDADDDYAGAYVDLIRAGVTDTEVAAAWKKRPDEDLRT